MQTDALFVAFIGQFFQNIAFERGSVYNVIIGISGMEHRKTFVVTAGEADVFGPGCFDGGYPLGGIELGRIESSGQLGVFLVVQVLLGHGPFARGQHGIQPPMKENSESAVSEFLTGFQVFRSRDVVLGM